jgi:hypothetical protein
VPAKDLAAAQRPGKIRFDDVVPNLFGEIEGRPSLRLACAIDENVDFSESADGGSEQALKRRPVSNVGGDAQALLAETLDLPGGRVDLLLAAGARGDIPDVPPITTALLPSRLNPVFSNPMNKFLFPPLLLPNPELS